MRLLALAQLFPGSFTAEILACGLLLLSVAPNAAAQGWPMAGANHERTSFVPEQVNGPLTTEWYRPIEAYIGQSVQLIAGNDLIYVSSARGLYALAADSGDLVWRYDTEVPLGDSPTLDGTVVYVGGHDRRLHALDALTGTLLWTFDGASAGIDTNPLIVNGRVHFGARDGTQYAIGAHGAATAGELIWSFNTGAPIRCSPAYADGVIYFASDNCRAYALDEATGTLLWQSEKLPTAGFGSWWPVIYRDVVVFSGRHNYYGSGRDAYIGDFTNVLERNDVLPQAGYIGPFGNEPGDWADGTPTMDASAALDYFAAKPWRRTSFVLSRADGTEMDVAGSYAPILSTFSKAENRYPPVVGADDVLYQKMLHRRISDNKYDIPRCTTVGWKIGTPFVSIIAQESAVDEPEALSIGGNHLYRNLCCSRLGGWNDYTIPGSSTQLIWHYGAPLATMTPGFDVMWTGVTDHINRLVGQYGSLNGVYHTHGDQNPIIPYNGRVYTHRENAVFCFGPAGGAVAQPVVPIVDVVDTIVPRTRAQLRARLSDEVSAMITAGRLQPGYFASGHAFAEWAGLEFIYQNPADTHRVLLAAIPHLDTATADALRTYLQEEFESIPPDMYAQYGWADAAPRGDWDIPPEVWAQLADVGPNNDLLPDWRWNWPPQTLYAMWKYAEEFGGAAALFERFQNLLGPNVEPEFTDERLTDLTWELNMYIAGYIGYLELEALAGAPPSAAHQAELDRLLDLWVNDVELDSPWHDPLPGGINYHARAFNVARNFIWLVPELGDHLVSTVIRCSALSETW